VRTFIVALILLAACGSGGPATASVASPSTGSDPSAGAERSTRTEDVDVHLGCTVITTTMVDERLAAARPWDDGASRADVRSMLVRRAVAHRIARQRHIEVRDEDVDRAAEQIAMQAGISIDELYATVAERGADVAAYRAELTEQLVVFRVGSEIATRPPQQAIDAEVARRLSAATQAVSRDDVHDAAEHAMWEAAVDDALDRAAADWMRVPVHQTNTECVEGETTGAPHASPQRPR